MSTQKRALSPINIALLSLFAGLVAINAVRGEYGTAVIFAAVLAGVAWPIARARKGQGSTYTRVSAFQPYDERDDALMRTVFSVTAQVVFVLQSAVAFGAMLLHRDVRWELVRLIVVAVVAMAATAWVARRG